MNVIEPRYELAIFDLKAAVSPKRCKIEPKLLLITNMKSQRGLRLVPKSATSVDLELTLNGHCALCYITNMSFGVNHKNLNEDRPILSAAKNVTQGS